MLRNFAFKFKENPSFISCDDLPKNIQIIFNFLQHVFTKFDLILLLVFNKILGTILTHTFCIPRLCSKIIHLFRLIWYHSYCQPAIILHQLLHSSDVFICPHCGRLSRFGIILHFVTAFLTLVMFSSVLIVEGCLVLGSSSTLSQPFSKDLHPQHHIFTINLFKKFKTVIWSLHQFHQKLKVNSLFHSWDTNSYVTTNSMVQTNATQSNKIVQRLSTLCYIIACNTKTEWLTK